MPGSLGDEQRAALYKGYVEFGNTPEAADDLGFPTDANEIRAYVDVPGHIADLLQRFGAKVLSGETGECLSPSMESRSSLRIFPRRSILLAEQEAARKLAEASRPQPIPLEEDGRIFDTNAGWN